MESNSRNLQSPDIHHAPAEQQLVHQPAKDDSAWIINESMLRDEGALYGIASADITDKLQAIASFFQTRMAGPLQRKEYLQQRIQELSLVNGVNEAEADRIGETLESEKRPANNMLPLLFQLIAVTAVCVFNFFLIQWWLNPVIKSDLICLGIYLAGLFSVYIGRGLSYGLTETAATSEGVTVSRGWKMLLKEFGVAAALAVFICTLTSEVYPIKNTLAAGLIFFLLFLIGKVLLATFSNFRQQASVYLGFTNSRYRLRRERKLLFKRIETATTSLAEARSQLQEPETILKKLQAEQDYKTRLFLSEYHLAVESRQLSNKLPSKQFA